MVYWSILLAIDFRLPTVGWLTGEAGVCLVTSWWLGLLLGAVGAAVADGTKISAFMLTFKRWPWTKDRQRAPFFVGLLIRIACAAALSSVVATQPIVGWSDQPLALFLVGLSAPTLVQHGTRLGRAVLKAIMAEYSGAGGD
ncbi:hypothetical protein [Dactylosporangium sp. CA-139066]|uniref:hypothetical protein n=1 Tax=Dactylosporangium sp. CA-139066 TaxID=3239930 RepID=UPI003D8D235F